MPTIKLQATEKGYYGDEIIVEGQTFNWEMPQWAIDAEVPLEKAIPPWTEPVNALPKVEVKEPEMTEDERESKIISAVNALDHSDSDHWTEGGDPLIDAVNDKCGFRVSRAEVKALCPGVEREE